MASPAAAQLSTYAAPGGLGERRLDLHDAMVKMRGDARWQIGFLDVEPQLSLTDLGWVSNVYSTAEAESVSDLRAKGLVGLRGFFNLGPKMVVSPFAQVSHAWWQEQKELRSTNESFGLQLLGDFNRLTLSLLAGQLRDQRNLSSELEVPVDHRADRLQLDVEIDFWGPFRLFAEAATDERRHSGAAAEQNIGGLDLSALDADSERLGAGIGYRFPGGLVVDFGVERTETEFLVDPGGRSNRGTGQMVRVGFEGTRLFLDLEAAWRDLEFDAQQGRDRRSLRRFGLIEWSFTRKLGASAYGGVKLEASALNVDTVFESRRRGVSLRLRQERSSVRLFYELGSDEFERVEGGDITRSDDFQAYGVGVAFELTPRLSVDLGFFDSRRESTDPMFDRDFAALRSVIRLGGDLLPW